MRLTLVVLSVLAGLLVASTARAQIVYEPVQYQYRAFGKTYYYGGSDPYVFRHADRTAYIERYFRPGRHPFGGVGYGDNARYTPQTSVYSDFFSPHIDAANYGLTSADARNEAMASLPRYFRKSDLFASARLDRNGTIVVPATAPEPNYVGRGTIEIRPWNGTTATVKPSARGLIIPKKVAPKADKPQVASR